MTKKNKIIIGYIIILIAIAIPLSMTASMTYRNYSQKNKYQAYKKETESVEKDKIFKEFDKYNTSVTDNEGLVDPFDAIDYKITYPIDIDKDKPFAYIKIPKIDLVRPVYLGASDENLEKGLAHIDGTSLPIGGKGKRSVIAGHRGWYGDTLLVNAEKLEIGDSLSLDLMGKVLKYKMVSSEIISPEETEKLQAISDKDMITLLTCDPKWGLFENRLLINFERVDEVKVQENNSGQDTKNEDKTEILSVEEDENKSSFNKRILFICLILTALFVISLAKMINFIIKARKYGKNK